MWNIALYRNMHRIAMFRDILYRDPCIVMHILLWSLRQYPALL